MADLRKSLRTGREMFYIKGKRKADFVTQIKIHRLCREYSTSPGILRLRRADCHLLKYIVIRMSQVVSSVCTILYSLTYRKLTQHPHTHYFHDQLFVFQRFHVSGIQCFVLLHNVTKIHRFICGKVVTISSHFEVCATALDWESLCNSLLHSIYYSAQS